MLKAVIFDVDGVIVDSERIYCEAVQETFRHYGVEITDSEYVRRWMIEMTASDGVVRDHMLCEKYGVTLEDVRTKKAEILHGLIDAGVLKMMPHALELLDRMDSYPKAIVTSDSQATTRKKLESVGLWDRFAVKVCSGDTERNKRYPDPWLKVVELLGAECPGLRPGETLAIEDNPPGAKSAKEAGCRVIAFPNGYTRDMEFPGTDRIVYTLDGIDEEMLDELFPDRNI